MKSLLIYFGLLSTFQVYSQRLISVESDSTSQFFTDLQTAYNAANSGDVIYLPGGATFYSLLIDKDITIIGAGYSMDSSSTTGITVVYSAVITQPNLDVHLEGIYFQTSVGVSGTNTTEVNISRCSVEYLNSWGAPNMSGLISETEIRGRSPIRSLYCGGALAVEKFSGVLANCVIYNTIGEIHGATVKNCVFLDSSSSQYTDVNNTVFSNNIFLTPCFDQKPVPYPRCSRGSNNQFINNLFIGSACFENTNYFSGNQFNVALASVFSNYPGNTYNPGNRYEINPSGPAANAGFNGTDIGITGGDFPWKPGGVPHNPHFNKIIIAGQTNADGTLPVEIRVKAQER
ncbi:right-handed parallel beta-helix repeat-containing protein [Phaeocystidibacter marisrubri]|uniref:Right-handed parallel beta-helix repeat-containing protein n=1 Tax=Phaeocystidibacter marisrubri TaxID=1577780 RepID=A0A6L3ZD96_9FLAO|nr:hypothetical protein [Phaeocystidibacter marisrubri]KAB2815823.1 hypothetical protein F8C82_08990 [Phaeocystidibacter marisrubri]GGH65894.1 hypothetical protein GCM10011318_03330 [Phaeocystidibacter marisrubri]